MPIKSLRVALKKCLKICRILVFLDHNWDLPSRRSVKLHDPSQEIWHSSFSHLYIKNISARVNKCLLTSPPLHIPLQQSPLSRALLSLVLAVNVLSFLIRGYFVIAETFLSSSHSKSTATIVWLACGSLCVAFSFKYSPSAERQNQVPRTTQSAVLLSPFLPVALYSTRSRLAPLSIAKSNASSRLYFL